MPDKFCLDGARLIPRPLSASGVLQPEFDSSVLVKVDGSVSDPDDFIVYRANGRIEMFGWRDSESNSRLRASPVITPVPTSRTSQLPESAAPFRHTLEWHLDRIEDRFGNYLDINYDRTVDPGIGGAIEVVPAEIRWTGLAPPPGGSGTPASPSRRIVFVYQSSPKEDVRIGYRAGIAIKSSKLLSKIQILAQDGLVSDPSSPAAGARHVKQERIFREYDFGFLDSGGRSVDRLSSLTECVFASAGTKQCLDPVNFGWSDVPSVPQFVRGDVASGNTVPDFPLPNTGTYEDGKHDPNGTPHPVGFVYDIYAAVVGDFNGDGRSDIVYRLPALNTDGSVKNVSGDWESPVAQGDWYLRLGTPTGLGPRVRVPGLPSSTGGDWAFSPRVMDVDGDGKDELLLFGDTAQPDYEIYRLEGCGSAQSACDFSARGELETGSWLEAFKGRLSRAIPYLIGDMDGDGLPDLVREDSIVPQCDPNSTPNCQTFTQLSFGAGGSPGALPSPTFADGIELDAITQLGDDRYVTDIDGHGQQEVLAPVYNAGASSVTLSSIRIPPPDNTSLDVTQITPTTLIYEPPDDCNEITRYFADMNGDGLADSFAIAAVKQLPQCNGAAGTINISINSGSAFRLPSDVVLPPNSPSISPAVQIINTTTDTTTGQITAAEARYFDQGIRIADLDQDGRADVLFVGQGVQWLRPGATAPVVDLQIPISGAGHYEAFPFALFLCEPLVDSCLQRSQNGGYGPRIVQVGDFNGDGLLDVVGMDSTSGDSPSNLTVYLQSTHAPDLVTSIDGGRWKPKRTIAYGYASAVNPSIYTRGQCGWPQTCLKSVGWVVTSSTVESSNFGASSPGHTVTDYTYADAKADRTGRGILGMARFTKVVRDDVSNRLFERATLEFNLTETVCQDAAHNMCAYVGTGQPSLQIRDIPIVTAGPQRGGSSTLIDSTHHSESRTQPTIKPVVPGSFGYKVHEMVTTTLEEEDSSRPLGPATQQALRSTRVTRTFDEFDNLTSASSEVSADPLPLNGGVATGQMVYSTTQKFSTGQTPLVGQWLISRYPQYQLHSFDPTLPGRERQLTQTVSLTYEPNSVELKSLVVEPDAASSESGTTSGFALTSTFTRDERGSVTSLTDEGSASQRTTTLGFDPNDADRIFPVTTADALSHTVSSYPDAVFGLPQAQDDPNGIRTEYEYDAVGRLKSLIPPGGAEHQYRYPTYPALRGPILPSRNRGTCESSDATETRCSVFDPAGRVIQTTADGFDQKVETQFTYDPLGRLLRQSFPFSVSVGNGAPAAFIEYSRDGLERVVDRRRPGPTPQSPPYLTHIDYSGRRSVLTDERGFQTTSDFDSKGRVTRRAALDPTTGREVEVGYEYGHFDLLRTIRHPALPASQAMTPSPAPLVTSYGYDRLGRLEWASDPDSGISTALYDAFGEAKRLQDGAGGVTTYKYDDLGRITWIETPADSVYPSSAGNSWAQRTHVVYDSAANGVGRVAETVSNDGIVNDFSYDQFGRLSGRSWIVPGLPDALSYSFEYNPLGQLEYTSYPGTLGGRPFLLQYSYAGDGEVQTITDSSDPKRNKTIWSQVSRNAAGQSTEEHFGSAEVVQKGYDSGSQLQSIRAKFGSGSTLFQDLEYGWDPNGLLQSRTDNDPDNPIAETFTHDFLGRLTDWQVRQNDSKCVAGASTTEWQYQYDDLGNLRTLETAPAPSCPRSYPSTTFDYTSAADSAHPHAPKALTTGTDVSQLTYDGAGQLLSGTGNTYTWTPFGLPGSISRVQAGNSVKERFAYDGAGVRTVTSLTAGASVKQSPAQIVDIGGLFQLRRDSQGAITQRSYDVAGPGGIVAQVVRTGPSAEATYFIHPDHLGSPDAITSGGKLLERGKYEPFGDRRSPSDLGRPESQPHRTGATIGFTGQRPDDEFAIIDMGGRLYDPHTAHFISPDPLNLNPGSEGLNKYSYVWNSPLSFTDPTGLGPSDEIQLPLDATSATTIDFEEEPDLLYGPGGGSIGDGISFSVMAPPQTSPDMWDPWPGQLSPPPLVQSEPAPSSLPLFVPVFDVERLVFSAGGPSTTVPPDFAAQTGAPNIRPGMCIGEVCNNGAPQLNLPNYTGPWERLEQQRVAEFNRDVRNAKLLAEVALTVATMGAGAVVAETGVAVTEGIAVAEEEGTTLLYRAVMPRELADIQSTTPGVLRNLGSAEGKYFTTSPEAASSYAKQAVKGFREPPYTIIRTKVPNSIFEGLEPATVDRGIPTWVIPNDRLPGFDSGGASQHANS